MRHYKNHTRCKLIYDSWPDWKKEVTLTKYSKRDKNTEAADRKGARK